MKALLCKYFLCIVCAIPTLSHANCPSSESHFIKAIGIEGNNRTQSEMIIRESNLKVGTHTCNTDIETGIEKIRSMGLFTDVKSVVNSNSLRETNITIKVQEKWTTIPIFKINSGGGVTQYTLGVYDPNAMGKFIELGTQYENLAGISSGVIWYKNPRLFGKRQGIDVQYWNTRRIRTIYNSERNDPVPEAGFLHKREKFYIDYFKEIKDASLWRVSMDYNYDKFSTEELPQNILEKNSSGFEMPPSTKLVITKIGIEFGQVKGESHMLSGYKLTTSIGYALPLKREVSDFSQGDIGYLLYVPLSTRTQFAQRIQIGATSTDIFQYRYYLGGLDRLRGFSDNRFSGRFYSLSNSEFRFVISQQPSIITQGVSFIDFAGFGEHAHYLFMVRAASLGAGIRLILPHFYRFVLRLDFAKPLVKTDSMNWSFGVQHFF
ncbi:MAG: BamA/TamA family outer membrane protein [Bdellovibrionales bacterium]